MRIPDNVDFNDYIKIVGDLEAQEIHPAGHWGDKLLAMANGPEIRGDKLPWSKTHGTFRMRPGEVTLWAGINGHKKSMMLGQVMLHLAKSRKIAIASMEMFPEETLWRMCCQAAGSNSGRPSEQFIKDFTGFIDQNVLIYDQLDSVKTEKILGFVHYCGREMKCDHIVLDSLSKCGIRNDIDAENDFINRLAWAAKHLKTHIHLVHHVRKPPHGNPEYKPTKFDIKGSGSLTDLVDNVAIVWADKKRESIKEKQYPDIKDNEYLLKSSDQELIIEKQRHGKWEGYYRLFFHQSGQFLPEDKHSIPFDMKTEQAA